MIFHLIYIDDKAFIYLFLLIFKGFLLFVLNVYNWFYFILLFNELLDSFINCTFYKHVLIKYWLL